MQRLEETMEQEHSYSVEVESKKRSRSDSELKDSNVSAKSMAIEKFRQMSVKQLREQAVLHGLAKSGTKKELIERLSKAVEATESKDALIRGVYIKFNYFHTCGVFANFNNVLF